MGRPCCSTSNRKASESPARARLTVATSVICIPLGLDSKYGRWLAACVILTLSVAKGKDLLIARRVRSFAVGACPERAPKARVEWAPQNDTDAGSRKVTHHSRRHARHRGNRPDGASATWPGPLAG